MGLLKWPVISKSSKRLKLRLVVTPRSFLGIVCCAPAADDDLDAALDDLFDF
jgi:hypothetical protein